MDQIAQCFKLILADAGPNRAAVFTTLRNHLQLCALEAKVMVDSPRQVVAQGSWWELKPLTDALRHLEASAYLRVDGSLVSVHCALELSKRHFLKHEPLRIEGHLTVTSVLSYLGAEPGSSEGILVQQPELLTQIPKHGPVVVGGIAIYYGRAIVEGALWSDATLPMFPGIIEACAVTIFDQDKPVTLEFAA